MRNNNIKVSFRSPLFILDNDECMRILMVCLGNICRSPLAEGIMKHKFQQYGLKAEVDSAGIVAFHAGEPPDSRAIAVAEKHGVRIDDQIARKFEASDFDIFDVILTMDEEVHIDILKMATNTNHATKVKLFMSYAGTDLKEVPDPYYGGQEGFENVFQMIDKACDRIAQSFLKKQT